MIICEGLPILAQLCGPGLIKLEPVMDNFSSHKVEGIREAIEVTGARLLYLPSYSPDFSPIENCWSKIKERLRSIAARTYKALDDAITEAMEAVSSEDIIGWFSYCCYYLFQRLGETHPNTQTVFSNFIQSLSQALQAGKGDRLSDHPLTQAILTDLRSQS